MDLESSSDHVTYSVKIHPEHARCRHAGSPKSTCSSDEEVERIFLEDNTSSEEPTTPRMTRRVFVRTPCSEQPSKTVSRGAREMSLYKMAWRESAIKTIEIKFPSIGGLHLMDDSELYILLNKCIEQNQTQQNYSRYSQQRSRSWKRKQNSVESEDSRIIDTRNAQCIIL